MKLSQTLKLVFLISVAAALATAAMAQKEKVIHSFPSGTNIYSRLYEDDTGALYGTEYVSRVNNGTIFEMAPVGDKWTENSIFGFGRNYKNKNGSYPYAGLVEDSNGVFYGTAEYGGRYNAGTVFSLSQSGPKSSDGMVSWSLTVLHSFSNTGGDGNVPLASITIGKAGELYGITEEGGNAGCGTVFELTPSGGVWTETTLYNFQGGNDDGCDPWVGLHRTKAGTLFGITGNGGNGDHGTVFMLQETNGVWNESVLHMFTGDDGDYPSDLDLDDAGNLYGVTSGGGIHNHGVVFELTKDGKWKLLYEFRVQREGYNPLGLLFDEATGVLYGTTLIGGSANGGTVFKLARDAGQWTETVLHSFGTSRYDGVGPYARPIKDKTTGVLYGTTAGGGVHNGGTVWALTQ